MKMEAKSARASESVGDLFFPPDNQEEELDVMHPRSREGMIREFADALYGIESRQELRNCLGRLAYFFPDPQEAAGLAIEALTEIANREDWTTTEAEAKAEEAWMLSPEGQAYLKKSGLTKEQYLRRFCNPDRLNLYGRPSQDILGIRKRKNVSPS